MRRADEIPTVRVELIAPLRPEPSKQHQVDPAALLKRLVEQQVAEILANRDDFLFQPFFRSKKVADEIKRLQTVPEQRKWGAYYARHGCLICETKERAHQSCGMCQPCYGRTQARLKSAISATESDLEDGCAHCDQQDLAREALNSVAGLLPAAVETGRE